MPKRVLVVDDDPSQRHTIEETIKRLGYHVAGADSGESALAALAADSAADIALVFLDLFMPDVDGPAVLSAPFRASPRSSFRLIRAASTPPLPRCRREPPISSSSR
jgi:CheY-like chemotaxis protein